MSSKAGSRKRRRPSPSYEDYPDTLDRSSADTYSVSERLERYRLPSSNEFRPSIPSSQYPTRSQYSNYRRESDEEHEKQLRSASPRQATPPHRTSPPPYVFKDSSLSSVYRLNRLSPAPKRAEPTDDYLLTSLEHSRRVDDPTQSRKLVILDLNGSLLLRSPHARRAGRGTQQPRLRSVYPRPYFTAFRSYIFHEKTKRWLDVMVWSSAQPHSVNDMVDHCFRDRKKELQLIWARDTLGLNQDEYHRKTQTLKDLEKPWAKIDGHSALTTMLIDDSPQKAALQPWNHLCVKEYVAEIRSSDLGVANWEAARRRLHEAREALEREIRQKEDLKKEEQEKAERLKRDDDKLTNDATSNPENTKVYREVEMVRGKFVGEEHLLKKVVKEIVMVDGVMVEEHDDEGSLVEDSEKRPARKRKRKMKRFARKEAALRVKEELAQETAKAVQDEETEDGEIEAAELKQEHESEEMKLEALAPKMKYDETLLAVIGVLDHIKHESSIAGWIRHGGLLNVELAEDASRLSENPHGSSPKKRRLNDASSDKREASFNPLFFGGDPVAVSHNPPSPSNHSPSSPSASPLRRYAETDEQAPTDPPPSPSHWFDRPAIMSYWANRGRRALQSLEISAESGVTLM